MTDVRLIQVVDAPPLIAKLELGRATPSANEWYRWHWGRQEAWKLAVGFEFQAQMFEPMMDGTLTLQPPSRRLLASLDRATRRGSQLSRVYIPRPTDLARAERRRVRVRRWSSGRLDRVNFESGCKGLLDVLVILGILHDDAERWLDDQYEQVDAPPGASKTEIDVWSLQEVDL